MLPPPLPLLPELCFRYPIVTQGLEITLDLAKVGAFVSESVQASPYFAQGLPVMAIYQKVDKPLGLEAPRYTSM